MVGNIKIIPLAAESLGVRSLCTCIKTPHVTVLVDPGVSLGPRFGLLPHPREYACLKECREKIARSADEADVVTISHYHFDHATPTFVDYVWNFSDLEVALQIYREKIILAKGIRSNINASQRRRGWMLKNAIKDSVKEFIEADNRTFTFGDTKLSFSQPVPHGEADTPLGWVLILTVEHEDDRVICASDVQGPIFDRTLEIIIAQHPSLVYLGGPPIYLSDYRIPSSILEHGLMNASKLVEEVPTVIFDHHLLRSEKWRETSHMIFEAALKVDHRIATAASFIGEEEKTLESRRNTVYADEPPLLAFNKWLKLPEEKRRCTKPPL
jgi:predicted metallo-beta-lactamase superfamily hydrolase